MCWKAQAIKCPCDSTGCAVCFACHLTEYDWLFGVDICLTHLGVLHGIREHGQCGRGIFRPDSSVEMCPVIGCRGIEGATQVLYRRINISRFLGRRALEDQMLHEVRDSIVLRRLTPRSRSKPDIHCHQVRRIGRCD